MYLEDLKKVGTIDTKEPKPGEWHCNICNRNYAASNRTKHEKTKKHAKKQEQSDVLENIGYYGDRT